MNWIIISISGLLSGIFSAMGMGGGGVLIICLTIFFNMEQIHAQGINILFFIPNAIIAIIAHSRKKLIDWKITLPLSFYGALGALIGSYASSFIDNSILKKIFGIFLLVTAIKQFFSK